MLKTFGAILTILVAFVTYASGAEITLRNGQTITGTILEQNDEGMEVETARNSAGTIRTIMRISFSEISSWRGERSVADDTQEMGTEVSEEGLAAMIREGEQAVAAEDYRQARETFLEVAERTAALIPTAGNRQNTRLWGLRTQAYELLLATLEAQMEVLEEKVEEAEDQMDEEEKTMKNRWSEFERNRDEVLRKEEQQSEVKRVGTKHLPRQLERHEELLRTQIRAMTSRHRKMKEEVRGWKNELRQASAELKVMEERADQVADEAKQVERAARKRR